MSGKDEVHNKDFTSAQDALSNVKSMEDERNNFRQLLIQSRETLNIILAPVVEISSKINEEMNRMKEDKKVLEFGKELGIKELNGATLNSKIREQELFIEEQKGELAAKILEQETLEKECLCLQMNLEQKHKNINDLKDEIKKENQLFEEQQKTLALLTSTSESDPKLTNLLEEHNSLLAESSKLDELISSAKNEIETIRIENSKISEDVTELESQYSSNLTHVNALRSIIDANKAAYERAESENYEIQSAQTEEEDRLEQQLSELQTKYENITKAADNINSEIVSEIIHDGSLEELLLQAKRELHQLDVECLELIELNKKLSVQIADNTKASVKEESDPEEQFAVRPNPVDFTRNSESAPAVEIEDEEEEFAVPPNPLVCAQKSESAPAVEIEDQQEEFAVRHNPVDQKNESDFLHPSAANLSPVKKAEKRRLPQQQPVRDQNVTIQIQRADSSMEAVDPFDITEDGNPEETQRCKHILELYKKHFL